MAVSKFNTIKTKEQYKEYADLLKGLIFIPAKTKEIKQDIDALTAFIEEWDDRHNSFADLDPVATLRSLMLERTMTSAQLSEILGINEEFVSDVLNYKKRLPEESIAVLSEYFKLDQAAFDRDYDLNTAR
jgi:antitoxin component HigA of HigAB toxin-antitoxin module